MASFEVDISASNGWTLVRAGECRFSTEYQGSVVFKEGSGSNSAGMVMERSKRYESSGDLYAKIASGTEWARIDGLDGVTESGGEVEAGISTESEFTVGNSTATGRAVNADYVTTEVIVSENTLTLTANLNDSHGVKPDGTQYLDTDINFDLDSNFTLMVLQEVVLDTLNRRSGAYDGSNNDLGIGLKGAIFYLRANNTSYSLATSLQAGDMAKLALVYTALDRKIKCYVAGVLVGEVIENGNQFTAKTCKLLALADGVNNLTGAFKDAYLIPQALAPDQLLTHSNTPERTLYWVGDKLMSKMLPQSTIDKMQAGNGFWFPVCENNSAGNKSRDHSKPNPNAPLTDSSWKTIVNYSNSAIRDNGLQLLGGAQSALSTNNEFGLPIGLSKTGEYDWSKSGQLTYDNASVLPENFEIDIFVDASESVGIGNQVALQIISYDAGNTIIGHVTIYANNITSRISVNGIGTNTSIPSGKAIFTVKVFNNVVTTLIDGVETSSMALPIVDRRVLKTVGASYTGTERSDATTGLPILYSRQRTANEYALAITNLKTKHGVI